MWRLFTRFLASPPPFQSCVSDVGTERRVRRAIEKHTNEIQQVKEALGRAESDRYFATKTLDHVLDKLQTGNEGKILWIKQSPLGPP